LYYLQNDYPEVAGYNYQVYVLQAAQSSGKFQLWPVYRPFVDSTNQEVREAVDWTPFSNVDPAPWVLMNTAVPRSQVFAEMELKIETSS
jgi:hypothetical protein